MYRYQRAYYDATATIDDGSCILRMVVPMLLLIITTPATCDDGSCISPAGCTSRGVQLRVTAIATMGHVNTLRVLDAPIKRAVTMKRTCE